MTRPRLLYLGHTLPYPPDRGATVRNYHILRELAKGYDVDALFFHWRHEPTQMPLERRVAHLEALADVDVFPLPGERSAVRRWLDQARSLAWQRSETRWRFDHRVYRRAMLQKVFERSPRIIHMDSIVLHAYLPLLADRAVVLAHPWRESERLRQRAQLSDGLEAHYLERQAEWMETVEREWIPRVAVNLVSSDAERSSFLERTPDAHIETVPHAVDTDYFMPTAGTGHGLAFVGGTTAPTGRDALAFFAAEILPRLKRSSGLQTLEPISWIGEAREGDRQRYRSLGIDIMGYVEDIRPVVRPTACFIVPRRIAGDGTRVLQAWAMGKAVVSTSMGCADLEAVDGRNILIRDDAESFAQAVLDVLEDRELRRRLGEAGRKTVEERYSWAQRGRELRHLYADIEKTKAPGTPRP